MTRSKHNHPFTHGKYPLEVIHTDVVGPIPGRSFNGCRYFTHFTCDKTGFTRVYPMHHKSEASSKVREFQKTYEQPDRKIHRLRGDGGEMTAKEFQDFLTEFGIRGEPT